MRPRTVLSLSLLTVVAACTEGAPLGGHVSSPGAPVAWGPVQNIRLLGRAEKGPFAAGSTLRLQELEGGTLVQTGNSFDGTLYSNLGDYETRAAELLSPIARLSVQGQARSENAGHYYPMELAGYVPVADGVGNVNILTHLIAPRIENLVNEGLSFNDARAHQNNYVAASDSMSAAKNESER